MAETVNRDSSASDSTNIRFSLPADGVRDSIATSGIRDSYLSYSTGPPESIITDDEVDAPLDKNVAKEKRSTNAQADKWYKRRRFWTICGFSTIILTVILVPVIIFGIFPKIAQSSINKSVMTYNEVLIKDPITENSFKMSLSGTLSNAGGFSAEVSFPDPVQVYWRDALLGEIPLGSIKVGGGSTDFQVEDTFVIKDSAKFAELTTYQLTASSFTWDIRGRVKVKALGITRDGLHLNKQVTLSGGNGFANTEIRNITISTNVTGNALPPIFYEVYMYNPSPVGIHLGRTGFNVFYGDSLIGPGVIDDLTMVPGNNTFTMEGTISVESLSNVGGLMLLFSKIAQGQHVRTLAQGVYAEPGGNNISWVTTAITSLEVNPLVNTGPLPIPKFNRMNNLILSESTPANIIDDSVADNQLPFTVPYRRHVVKRDLPAIPDPISLLDSVLPPNPTLADAITAVLGKIDLSKSGGSLLDVLLNLIKPIIQDIVNGSTLSVNSTNISNIKTNSFTSHLNGAITNTGPISATMSFPSGITVFYEGTQLGKLILPGPITTQPNVGATIDQDAQFNITDIEAFTKFSGDMLSSKTFTWDLFADDLTISPTIFPFLTFNGLVLKKNITLRGFNGLKNVKIDDFEVVGPASSGPGVAIKLVNSIPDVADVGIELGDVTFDISSSGVFVGPASASDLTLSAQSTAKVPMTGEIQQTDENKASIGPMFSLFLAGKPIPLNAKGNTIKPPNADGPVPWLEIPFKQLVLDLVLQVPPAKLINNVEVTLTLDTILTGKATSQFSINNPVGADLSILAMDSTASFNGDKIGEVHQTLSKPIVVPGNGTITSPPVEITIIIPTDLDTVLKMLKSGGNIKTDIQLETSTLLATLPADIQYQQNGVPTTMNFDLDFLKSIKTKATPDQAQTIDNFITETGLARRNMVKRDAVSEISASLDSADMSPDSPAFADVLTKIKDNQITESQLGTDGIKEKLKEIVQKIIDQSKLNVDGADIFNIKANQFTSHLTGSITNTGIIPATISFPSGVTVSFEKDKLGKMDLKPVTTSKNGAKIDDDAKFHIADVDTFTKFSGFMMASEKFTWDLFADDVVVSFEIAGQPVIEIDGLTLKQSVTLKGFDGLQKVKIDDFKVVGPSKQGVGIEVALKNSISNPADVGIDLGDSTFDILLTQDVVLGSAAASKLKLPADKTIEAPFSGVIVETDKTKPAIGQMFSLFLAGKPIPMIVRGKTVSPPGAGGSVPWLEIPFQQLSMKLVLKVPAAQLIEKVDVILDSSSITTGKGTAQMTLVNPIDTEIGISYIKSKASLKGVVIGTVDQTLKTPFLISAKKSAVLTVNITIPTGGSPPPIGTPFKTDVVSTTGMVIGQATADVQYEQQDVTTVVTVKS